MADFNKDDLSPELKNTVTLMEALLENKGATLGQLQGLDQKDLEALYTVAYNFYRGGRFDDASKVFRYLCLLDHLTLKFWLGLGAAEQMKKSYKSALKAYAYASLMDLKDPRAQLHAAECNLALGDKANAISALTALLEYCPQTPELEKYRKKAQAMMGLINISQEKPAK